MRRLQGLLQLSIKLTRLTIFVFGSMMFLINFTYGQPANTPWPMYHHDPQHTGRTTYAGPAKAKLLWSFTARNWIQSSAAIGSGGTIYVGSSDYNLYAINPDGTFKWSFRTDSYIDSSPAIGADGTIYIASIDNNLYAIHPDGTLKWTFQTGDDVSLSPVIGSDGIIYIGSGDGKIYAINPDGSLKWEFTAGDKIGSSPAIGIDGTLYAGSWDRKLYAINPDGTQKWATALGNLIFSSPSVGSDGTIYVGSDDGKLYAINSKGNIKWAFLTGGNIASCPAIGVDGTIYVGSFDRKLYAINSDGTLKWEFTTGDLIWGSSPAIDANGVIYIGSFDNKLYAINPDGTLKWEFLTDDGIFASPAIGDNGTIYIGSKDRKLYAIGAGTLPNGYPSLNEIIDRMNAAAAAYPAIAKVVDLTMTYNTPTTYHGRHIYVIKISDNVTEEEDEPDVIIVSNHHASEVVTPVIALHAIEQLTSKYGSDPRITAAVNNNEIWIAPTWNPDGYNYVFTVNNSWRKNRRAFPDGIGVDLNRNYPHLWDSPHSGDTDVASVKYKGPLPASEAETQTMIAFALDQSFDKLIDFHSQGREVLYGYYERKLHPFDDWLRQEAMKLSTHSGYAGKTRGPSADGENYQWHLARFGTYAFLVETHTEFVPIYESALAEANTVLPGILWDIERVIPLSGHVTDENTGAPVEAKIELIGVNFQTGETNSSGGPFGRYHLFLPPEQYNIRFSADGYLPTEQSVTITSETAQILDIQLSPEPTAINNPIALSGDAASPEKMILKGNYPNPFNSETTINYQIKEIGNIQLEIYDLTGRHIKTLVNSIHNPGSYAARWDASNESGHVVASNMYLYRITFTTAGKMFTQVGKMLLMN